MTPLKMIGNAAAVLFVAHPGHELLVHGWLTRAKPRVMVLTDGSGHSSMSRLRWTQQFLLRVGAPPGNIFGRLTDRQAYSAILERDADLIVSLASDLAAELTRHRTSVIVVDAHEGYNPVHDLCRWIAGAACQWADTDVALFEYPVIQAPDTFARLGSVVDLDDAAFEAKLSDAREFASLVSDAQDILSRFGESAFRQESFRRIDDWATPGWRQGERPLYETLGEERVASSKYTVVIRYAEHMLPLRDALCAWADSSSRCAS